jgi:transcriptional regulator with XRE-family HTH domain
MTDKPLSLADLIKREQDAGQSYADIARATGMSKAKVGQLADPESTYQVRNDTLEKLSKGLRLPLRVVQSAAQVSAGMEPIDNEVRDVRIALMMSQLAELPAADVDVVELLINALANRTNDR